MPSNNVVEFSILADDRFSAQFNKLRSKVNQVAKLAAGFGAAFAAGAGVASKALIDVGSKTENLRVRMNAMLGSVGEGNKVFQDMTQFASEVPFAYDDIMESATQLSGIVKGGAAEIKATMPIIADLAAVSGLTIQQTTDQVSRMFSAGAGAADLFRERGITSMLGFQAGVSVSAEKSKQMLIEAFESPSSKFRGAALKMATTWDGVMSMIGDKWFAIKSQIADAGVFNYFKSIAIVINDMMGKALDTTKANAATWANSVIDGIRSVFNAVGFLSNAFRGFEILWKGLELAFAKVAQSIVFYIYRIIEGYRLMANIIPGIDLGKFEGMESLLGRMAERSNALKDELKSLAMESMPSEQIDGFMVKVEETFVKLQEVTLATTTATTSAAEQAKLNMQQIAEQVKTDYQVLMQEMGLSTQEFGVQFNGIMGDAVKNLSDGLAGALVESKNLSDAVKSSGKQMLKSLISMLIKVGAQRLILQSLNQGAAAKEATANASAAVATAGANGVASMAGAPFPINTTAPAFGAKMSAAASAAFTGGASAGAAVGAGTAALIGLGGVAVGATIANSSGGGDTQTVQSGGVVVEKLEVNITGQDLSAMDETQLEEFVAGPIIRTLDKLDDAGVRQKALERSNV